MGGREGRVTDMPNDIRQVSVNRVTIGVIISTAVLAGSISWSSSRLARQTNLQIMAGGVQWAQLDSMRQIGLLELDTTTNGHAEVISELVT